MAYKYGVWWEGRDGDKDVKAFWEHERFRSELERYLLQGASVETSLNLIREELMRELRKRHVL